MMDKCEIHVCNNWMEGGAQSENNAMLYSTPHGGWWDYWPIVRKSQNQNLHSSTHLYEVQHEVLWRRSENKIWKSLEIKNNFAFKVWNIFMVTGRFTSITSKYPNLIISGWNFKIKLFKKLKSKKTKQNDKLYTRSFVKWCLGWMMSETTNYFGSKVSNLRNQSAVGQWSYNKYTNLQIQKHLFFI